MNDAVLGRSFDRTGIVHNQVSSRNRLYDFVSRRCQASREHLTISKVCRAAEASEKNVHTSNRATLNAVASDKNVRVSSTGNLQKNVKPCRLPYKLWHEHNHRIFITC
jgi:hypothetical protein